MRTPRSPSIVWFRVLAAAAIGRGGVGVSKKGGEGLQLDSGGRNR